MANPKYDYDSEEFLGRLEDFAKKGYSDKEIAYELNLGVTYFSTLKSENDGMSEALARGRAKINNIVRQRLLAVGLGGIKVKSITKQKSKFSDLTTDQGLGDMIVHETETELAPNANVLSTWLFNHDEEWRQKTIEGKKLDVTTNGKDVGGFPLIFMSTEELTEEQREEYVRRNLESDVSSNNTSTR